jgi:hypothetical protein
LISVVPVLFAAAVAAAEPAAREVSVPMTFDHAILRRMLVEQMFTGPDESVRVWDDGSGCNFLVLSSPDVSSADDRIRVVSRGRARAGKRVGTSDTCITALDWTGTIEVYEEPHVDESLPIVRLRVVDSKLRGDRGRKGVTGLLWDLVKRYVQPRFEAVTIDLHAPLAELRAFLPLVLPSDDAARTERLLDSLSLAAVRASEDGVVARLRFEVEETAVAPHGGSPQPEPTLSPEEIERWEASLQQWDAFLTFVVKQAARESGAEDLRRAFLSVLVDARHDILDALAPETPEAPDPTRELFLHAWKELAPALRELSTGLPGEAALRYLSFIGAADALEAIDELGPASGLDISADGLRRLARILIPAAEDPLFYDTAVDPELRELFGFGPPLPLPVDAGAEAGDPDLLSWFRSWLVAPAHATKAARDPLAAKLNRWVPTRDEIDDYLPLVRDLLDSTVGTVLDAKPLDAKYLPIYRPLVLATAWQESCWRQYVRIGREVSPILSPAGSVGVMQINVRVWRGFYDAAALRNDIAYNAKAGGEILLHYMKDYAIARGEHQKPGGMDNLARATYSAYNAGPGQLARYRRPGVAPRAKRVDEAFHRKYQAMKGGRDLAVAECFGR